MNMKLHLTLIITLLIGQVSLAQTKDFEKAVESFDKYSYDTAAEKFQNLDRKSVEVRRKLAESAIRIQDYTVAETELAAIMNSDDKTAEDVLAYAEVLRINEKYEESQQSMEVYYELQPSDSRAQAYHGSPGYYETMLLDEGKFKVTNLPINSKQEDFGPAYYGDKVVFASSREGAKPVRRTWNWNRLPFLDLYVAQSGKGASIQDLKEYNPKGNGKYHEGPAAFDASGKMMVFTRNNYDGTDKNGVRRLKLFESRLTDEGWTEAKAFQYNSDEYSMGHATLTADGKTMYLASDMPGGQGGVDLYKCERNEDGTWTQPINLGDRINTEGNEMFPFIHHTGVLFFASDGHVGLGGLDVFATKLSGQGAAGPIKNLGVPVNSSRDDFSLIVDKNMSSGYFASNRTVGKGDDDLYYFEMLKPLTFGRRIEGIAMDKAGMPLPGTEVALRDGEGNILETVTTGDDGSYVFSVDPDMNYSLRGTLPEYFEGVKETDTHTDEEVVKADVMLEKDPGLSLYGLVSDKGTGAPLEGVKVTLSDNLGGAGSNYNTPSTGDFRRPITDKRLQDRISYNLTLEKEGYLTKTVTYNKLLERPGQYDVHSELDLSMTKLEVGMDIGEAININPIYFDVNKSNIRPDAAIELAKIVEVMNNYPTMVIELGSHTDCRASEAYNMSLSDRRAKSSAAWIKKKITDPSRIYGKGYGESQLVNHCACGRTDKNNEICSEEEHAKNRRTEFRIVKM
jgi:outer membrane protein OmpA-like peptidoglycan-associated protein